MKIFVGLVLFFGWKLLDSIVNGDLKTYYINGRPVRHEEYNNHFWGRK